MDNRTFNLEMENLRKRIEAYENRNKPQEDKQDSGNEALKDIMAKLEALDKKVAEMNKPKGKTPAEKAAIRKELAYLPYAERMRRLKNNPDELAIIMEGDGE